RLIHEAATEPSDASGTLLYDLTTDYWAKDVLDALDLRLDLLAPIRESAEICGVLSRDAAEHLGVRPNLPVVGGAADTAAAAIAGGLLDPGPVQLTIGSGAQVVAPRDRLAMDATARTHLYRAAAPDRWYAMAAMQNAGLAIEWVRTTLAASWAEVYAEAFAVPAGAQGLIFLPYLTGERTPHFDPPASASAPGRTCSGWPQWRPRQSWSRPPVRTPRRIGSHTFDIASCICRSRRRSRNARSSGWFEMRNKMEPCSSPG